MAEDAPNVAPLWRGRWASEGQEPSRWLDLSLHPSCSYHDAAAHLAALRHRAEVEIRDPKLSEVHGTSVVVEIERADRDRSRRRFRAGLEIKAEFIVFEERPPQGATP